MIGQFKRGDFVVHVQSGRRGVVLTTRKRRGSLAGLYCSVQWEELAHAFWYRANELRADHGQGANMKPGQHAPRSVEIFRSPTPTRKTAAKRGKTVKRKVKVKVHHARPSRARRRRAARRPR